MYIFLAIKVCQSRLVEGTAINIFLVLKGCFPSEKERNISLVKKRAIQVEEKQVLKSVNPVEWKAIFISLILKVITRVKQKAMYISLIVKRTCCPMESNANRCFPCFKKQKLISLKLLS